MRIAILAAGMAVLLAGCGDADAPEVTRAPTTPTFDMVDNPGFDQWVMGFRPRAMAHGITADTFQRSFAGVGYMPEVIRRDRNQSEFVKPIWAYLDTAVSDTRIQNGQAKLSENARVLAEVEARYGVPREVVVAVWGMESSYGSHRGAMPVIPSLATLAYDGRRGAFFEQQLIAALRIVQAGDVPPRQMTGSWAGAMGHTQFIPTSYLAYAVDFRGDGHRDIWSDDPTDALASTAAYLAKSGWVTGQPWGEEVILPAGFPHGMAGKGTRRPVQDWQAMGVRGANGALKGFGNASVLLPAGAGGPAFLIYDNFRAISRYNAADSYVIGVGTLSDRLKGGPPIRAAWPRTDRPLTQAERVELQERLTRKGYDTQGADGRLGSNSVEAIRSYQVASGLTPDGYPSLALLEHLR